MIKAGGAGMKIGGKATPISIRTPAAAGAVNTRPGRIRTLHSTTPVSKHFFIIPPPDFFFYLLDEGRGIWLPDAARAAKGRRTARTVDKDMFKPTPVTLPYTVDKEVTVIIP